MAQIAAEHAEASASTHANSTPLGLSAFALITFVLSAANASFIPASDTSFLGLAFFGGLGLFLAGMWEFRAGNTLHATAFTSYGILWLSYGYGTSTHTFGAGLSYYFLAWAVLSFVFLVSSLKTHGVLIAVFLFFTLAFVALTIGQFTGTAVWHQIGGWLGIITAILAAYSAMAHLLHSEHSNFHLPTFPMG
jgi:uncharacterized protein